MKQASSTTTIFKVILIFTFLFAGFLAVAITYNRAYKVKNNSLSILEKYEGVSKNTIEVLNTYLKSSGYYTKGKCTSEEYGVKDLESTDIELANGKKDYYYCLSYYCTDDDTICKIQGNNRIHYKFKLFFKFNLPIIGDLATFKITGETKSIKLFSRTQVMK